MAKLQKITPNIWYNRVAAAAVDMYIKLFPNSRITKTTYYTKEGFEYHHMPEGTVLTIEFELNGEQFVALNAGPEFPLNPSVSFMAICDTEEELDTIWKGLSDGGNVMMALDKYPWSPKYGWLNDCFGVSWQVYLADEPNKGQKIIPTLMFTGDVCGKAEEAIKFYASVFEDSKIEGILKYGPGEGDSELLVKHAQFGIRNYVLAAMDSSADHKFSFNEGVSLIVHCNDQEEVDRYWTALIAGGGQESQCGWLKDKYGMSWQIVPKQLPELLDSKDEGVVNRVLNAMFGMRKLIVADLEAAAEGQ